MKKCFESYINLINLGIYSQKIFTKLNHETLVSVNYEDFKDENGELYLKDTREHTSIISCYKKLQ